jgi:PAS domain S-box-containing protein
VLRRPLRRFLSLSFEQWFGIAVAAMVLVHLAALWALFAGGRGAVVPAAWFVAMVSALAVVGLGFAAYSNARALSFDLRVADERLLLTLESGRKVAWDWDVASGCDLWVGDLKTMFGIDARHFSGRVEDFHRRLHPDDRVAVANAVAEARANHAPYRATFRVVRTDGSTRWVNANGEFFYDAVGRPTRMLGIATDITEQTQAEEARRQREEHFREIADTAPVLLRLCAPNGRCTYVNQSWLDFTGQTLQGRPARAARRAFTPRIGLPVSTPSSKPVAGVNRSSSNTGCAVMTASIDGYSTRACRDLHKTARSSGTSGRRSTSPI